MKHTDILKEFLNGSRTFCGITFDGLYTMSLNHFIELLRHYDLSGENLLDEYSKLKYLIWDNNDNIENQILEKDDYDNIVLLLSNNFLCDFFNEDDLSIVLSNAQQKYKRYLNTKSYSARRIQACLYTTNPTLRKKVFNLHGRMCLACKTDKNIQVDHVVSVKSGGLDELNNMQPLCKSCNSKKGSKTIDYRISI